MELNLTAEAINLIFLMSNNPGAAWKKEAWHPASKENADTIANHDVTALARWVQEKAMEKTIPLDEAKEQALALCERLKLIYASEDAEIEWKGAKIPRGIFRDNTWKEIDRCFGRPAKPGVYKLKQKYVDRLKDLIKHYRGKPTEGAVCLTMHFADLEDALEGKAPVKADDVEEAAETPA